MGGRKAQRLLLFIMFSENLQFEIRSSAFCLTSEALVVVRTGPTTCSGTKLLSPALPNVYPVVRAYGFTHRSFSKLMVTALE